MVISRKFTFHHQQNEINFRKRQQQKTCIQVDYQKRKMANHRTFVVVFLLLAYSIS